MNMTLIGYLKTLIILNFGGVIVHVSGTSLDQTSNNLGDDTNPLIHLAGPSVRALCSNYGQCGLDPFAEGNTTCCLKCTCESTCSNTHSCCTDTVYQLNPIIPYKSNGEGMVCRSGLLVGESEGIYLHPEYEFLQACPSDTPEEIQAKCENIRTTEKLSIVSSVPLYDTSRAINYANIYCAQCNNASLTSLEAWAPSLKCGNTIDSSAKTLSEIEDDILTKNCSLLFEPPEYDVTSTVCYNDVITTCNVTGRWIKSDSVTETLCEAVDMLYVSVQDKRQMYKNIFCAQCNGEHLYVQDVSRCPFRISFDLTQGFAAILQFSVSDINQYTTEQIGPSTPQNSCSGRLAFEPLSGQCMPVSCSSPHILDPQTFQCRTLFGETVNGIAAYAFQIVFKKPANFSRAESVLSGVRTKFFEFRDTCRLYFFYQTALGSFDETRTSFLGNIGDIIIGMYVKVSYYIRLKNPTLAKDEIRDFVELAFNNNDYNTTEPEFLDAGILYFDYPEPPVFDTSQQNFNFGPIGDSHYAFLNPYDNTVLVGLLSNTLEKSRCVENMYKTDYLQCPWFKYDVTKFSRTAVGLAFSRNDGMVIFQFDEFKTLSSSFSEVSICIDPVTERIRSLNSGQSLFRGAVAIWTIFGVFLAIC